MKFIASLKEKYEESPGDFVLGVGIALYAISFIVGGLIVAIVEVLK